jgi:hypothetical protein
MPPASNSELAPPGGSRKPYGDSIESAESPHAGALRGLHRGAESSDRPLPGQGGPSRTWWCSGSRTRSAERVWNRDAVDSGGSSPWPRSIGRRGSRGLLRARRRHRDLLQNHMLQCDRVPRHGTAAVPGPPKRSATRRGEAACARIRPDRSRRRRARSVRRLPAQEEGVDPKSQVEDRSSTSPDVDRQLAVGTALSVLPPARQEAPDPQHVRSPSCFPPGARTTCSGIWNWSTSRRTI